MGGEAKYTSKGILDLNVIVVRDSVFHPQTGEALPFVFRLANFAPVNVPICAGMLLSAPTVCGDHGGRG